MLTSETLSSPSFSISFSVGFSFLTEKSLDNRPFRPPLIVVYPAPLYIS